MEKAVLTQEKKWAGMVGRFLHTPLDISKVKDVKTGKPLSEDARKKIAADLLKDGLGQPGYVVPEGSSIDGSFAIDGEGEQGYFVKGGKEKLLGDVEEMEKYFARRVKRIGKPIKLILKLGIGGSHTSFQAVADMFKAHTKPETVIYAECELAKNYEEEISRILDKSGADWDQIIVIPSSKSGSTDETMLIFVDVLRLLLEKAAAKKNISGEVFAGLVLETLHDINFDGAEERKKDLFKIDRERFGTESLIELLQMTAERKGMSVSRDDVKEIFGSVIGNMYFETTPRSEKSRLAAFLKNSGLEAELDAEDRPGKMDAFDNVGGRWTIDQHMTTFLAYYGLNSEGYWKTRNKVVREIRDGKHLAVDLGNKILDEGITDIALLVPDPLFWFGKAIEQNFNESLWQDGFATLIAVKESDWDAQKKHYSGNPNRLVINLTDSEIPGDKFKSVKIRPGLVEHVDEGDDREKMNKLIEIIADWTTTFYGLTYTIGTRLVARAIRKKYEETGDEIYNLDEISDEELSQVPHNLDHSLTKVFQQNIHTRQPYVELGKKLLVRKLGGLREKTEKEPDAVEKAYEKIAGEAGETKTDKLEEILKDAKSQKERKVVPFIYLEGGKFVSLREELVNSGVEWVMLGTMDQHISYQQVLSQPQKFFPVLISFLPADVKAVMGTALPAVGWGKDHLHNIPPVMVRDAFAEASYNALIDNESRMARGGHGGGMGAFVRLVDSKANRDLIIRAFR